MQLGSKDKYEGDCYFRKTFEYHVYGAMSAGIGASVHSVYDDRNFDTVYFNEELAHDFASWCLGILWNPNIKMVQYGSDSRPVDYGVVSMQWLQPDLIKRVRRRWLTFGFHQS